MINGWLLINKNTKSLVGWGGCKLSWVEVCVEGGVCRRGWVLVEAVVDDWVWGEIDVGEMGVGEVGVVDGGCGGGGCESRWAWIEVGVGGGADEWINVDD